MQQKERYTKAVELLKALIATPSFSGEEAQTAALIAGWFDQLDIPVERKDNNVWATNRYFDRRKPTILLNSHHDTVRPNKNYSRDPFEPTVEEGKLYGLGSNDAGGCVVALMALFVHYYQDKDLAYNLLIALTAEEENSGPKGLRGLLPELPEPVFAIVGEPTEMQLAVSEKGLLVIDGYAAGISGHAAHENTENAIYNAMQDIQWIRTYEFPKYSETLGKMKMSVTQINAGEQHNVIPGTCHFVVDVRLTDAYSNKEAFDLIDRHTQSRLVARSFKHNSSSIALDHPIVQQGLALGRKTYGSPTLSDQSALSCPSLKIGPGVSARSHTADEFIYVQEIEEGIDLYIQILEPLLRSH